MSGGGSSGSGESGCHPLQLSSSSSSGGVDRLRYECSACGRTFSNVYNLKVHIRDQHSGLGIIRCEVCGVHLKNLSTLRVHKSNYHSRCDLCGDYFKNPAALKEHKILLHLQTTVAVSSLAANNNAISSSVGNSTSSGVSNNRSSVENSSHTPRMLASPRSTLNYL